MTTTDAFSAPGRFWKGNLHCHSALSDGALTPTEVCRRYREAGYDFIALTDHMIGPFGYPLTDTKALRTADFTTLIGAELHSGPQENGTIWHILALGLPDDFAPPVVESWAATPDQEPGPDLARRARAAGAYVVLAHPEWSCLTMEDALSLDAAHAVEVYNHGAEVIVDRGRGFWHLERLLDAGRDLHLIASDDAHFHRPDTFGGWTMVKAEENDPEALLAALKAGHHYASQGPEFHAIQWEADRVVVETSPVATVIVQGPLPGAASVAPGGGTRTEIPLSPRFDRAAWLRLTLVDAHGRKAWSNPMRRH